MELVKIVVDSKDHIGDTGIDVKKGTKMKLVDIEFDQWVDDTIKSDPLVGWNNWFFSFFNNLKQSKIHNYMRLIYSVGDSDQNSVYNAIEKNEVMTFSKDGRLYIKANDVIWLGIMWFYHNNKGKATLTFEVE